jgi:Sulfotransferase family
MGSTSLLLAISTALITWTLSIFYLSNRETLGIGSDLSSGLLFAENEDEETIGREEVPMQGLNKTFKTKIKTYINMTNYNGPSTIWKSYPYPFPCVPGEEKHMLITPAHEGILFQRPVKTGSTSMTGIILRLVERYKPPEMTTRCRYRAMHETSQRLDFANRDVTKSYLLSVVRDPTLKAISRYFHFDVTIGQKVPTDEHFQAMMRRPYNRNDLYQQLVPHYPGRGTLTQAEMVQEILGTYKYTKAYISLCFF